MSSSLSPQVLMQTQVETHLGKVNVFQVAHTHTRDVGNFTFPAQYCSKPLKNNSSAASHCLILSETNCITLWTPGRLTRRAAKTTLASALILLTIVGSIGTVLPRIIQALLAPSSSGLTPNTQCSPPPPNATTTTTSEGTSCLPSDSGVSSPLHVGTDPVPSLSLPTTVVSSVDSPIGAGGVIQNSSQNLTLFNSEIIMRLLSGLVPHDELLGSDHRVLSSWSFWSVEANASNAWVPLIPSSTSFSILGTNRTGTYVVRQMGVGVGPYSGTLVIAYKATATGPLKWDLKFTASATANYRLVYTWQNVSSRTRVSPDAKTS